MATIFGGGAMSALGLNRSFNIAQNALKRLAAGPAPLKPMQGAKQAALAQTALSRFLTLDQNNNRISTRLKAAEATGLMLQRAQSIVQQMQGLATQAMNLGPAAVPASAMAAPAAAPASPAPVGPVIAPGAVGAFPTADITRDTIVQGASAGMVLSITSDSRQTFQYVFSGPTNSTTWGQVADAFNAANIGVNFQFDTSNPAAPRMSITSTDGSSGFRINGNSGWEVVNDLTGMVSPYDGANTTSKFMNAGGSLTLPVATTGAPGMAFGQGQYADTVRFLTNPVAGSSVTFTGSDGITRTWTAEPGDRAQTMRDEINAMGGSVIAEFNFMGELRLRDRSGSLAINAGSGDFDLTNGVTRFETHAAPMPSAPTPPVPGPATPTPAPVTPAPAPAAPSALADLGQQFDALKSELAGLFSSPGLLGGQTSQMIAAMGASLGSLGSGAGWASAGDAAASINSLSGLNNALQGTMVQAGLQTSNLGNLSASVKAFAADMESFAADALSQDLTGNSATFIAAQLQAQLASKVASLGTQKTKQLLRLLG